MSKPTLKATFQPQQWIDDDAINCGPASDFDAGPVLLSMDARRVRLAVLSGDNDMLADGATLADGAGLLGDGPGQHSGPFYVACERMDILVFLAKVGITNVKNITDLDVVRGRAAYAAIPAEPTNKGPLPFLKATFYPQKWTVPRSEKADCGPGQDFDAGPILLGLEAKVVKSIVAMGYHDMLANAAGIAGDMLGGYPGPFRVGCDKDEMDAFLVKFGINDVQDLTEADLVKAREAYAAMGGHAYALMGAPKDQREIRSRPPYRMYG